MHRDVSRKMRGVKGMVYMPHATGTCPFHLLKETQNIRNF